MEIKFGKGIETVKPKRVDSVVSRLLNPLYVDLNAKTKTAFGEVEK